MGATTIWERWDGIKPDSTFQTPGMNSFNHYSYGAIGDWMYRTITGIKSDVAAPGYKHIIIAPTPGGDLTYAQASLETPYGPVRSAWKTDAGTMTVEVTIPANTSATITLPNAGGATIHEGKTELNKLKGLRDLQTDGDDAVFG